MKGSKANSQINGPNVRYKHEAHPRSIAVCKIQLSPGKEKGQMQQQPGVDPGLCEGGFKFVNAEGPTSSVGMVPREIFKSGTSETPFPGLWGWIWGKKGGSIEPIELIP